MFISRFGCRFSRKVATAVAILVLPFASLRAEGAGGILFGLSEPAWSPAFLPDASLPDDLEFFGGFGYGVSAGGGIAGGFGMACVDADLLSGETGEGLRLAGGLGGMIAGSRLIGARDFHLDFWTRLGLGGLGVDEGGWTGYAVFYAEPALELGLGLTPWMRLSAALGYKLIGNLMPGAPAEELLLHGLALNCAISWGDYY